MYPSAPIHIPSRSGASANPSHSYPTYTAAPAALAPISRTASPVPPGSSRTSDISRSPSMADIQIEKRARSPNVYGRPLPQSDSDAALREEAVYHEHVTALISAKNHQFAINGNIPVDPLQLVLFFRSKTGTTHSLDFPIDVSYNAPPALDVLIAACKRHQVTDRDDYGDRKALYYPPNLPLTASFEIANYPILDAVQSSLFPDLPAGAHLVAIKDRLVVIKAGGCLSNHSPVALSNDGRSATIILILPVQYQGGALVVCEPDGDEERFKSSVGKVGGIDWVAFPGECSYGIETVQKGCMLLLSYSVFVKNFSPSAPNGEVLISPTDRFFDLLSPILNMSRGKSIAFYLNHSYGVNPAEVLANSLQPKLKGADALLYSAFKMHKLEPELHWTTGGYVWTTGCDLGSFGDTIAHNLGSTAKSTGAPGRMPFGSVNAPRSAPVKGTFTGYGHPGYYEGESEALRLRVERSGGVPLAEAGITLLKDERTLTIGKERLYLVSNGELEKLVVNVILVVYIP